MKHLLLTLLLMLPFCTSAQIHFELTNPITLGMLLVDDTDQQRMEEICRHYHLEESAPEEGYSVFTLADGSKVRFKVMEPQTGFTKTPVIEITLSGKKHRAEDTLIKAGYRKTSTAKGSATYERGSSSANRHTVCTQTSPLTFLFTKSSLKAE